MEPGLLLIIAFIVAPLIERLLKAGREKNAPPQQPRVPPPPQPRMPAPRPPREEQEAPEPRVIIARRDEESAATMVPDDLWEILTGQTRAPVPAPTQQPSPAEYDDEGVSLEEEVDEELTNAEVDDVVMTVPRTRTSPDRTSGRALPEVYVRSVPERAPPLIVSMETLEFDDEKRHAKFHERLARGQAGLRAAAPKPKSLYRFTGNQDLQRSIVLAEVLGPPKGLQ